MVLISLDLLATAEAVELEEEGVGGERVRRGETKGG